MEDVNAFEEQRKKIWRILECPVCLEMVRSPVYLCVSGHHICNKCRPRCDNCPLCRQRFTACRNMAVEHILNTVPVPCKNSRLGCTSTFLLSESRLHENACRFRPYDCPADHCDEVVTRAGMVPHVNSCHPSWKVLTVRLHGWGEFCSSGTFRGDLVNVFDVAEWGIFFLHGKKKLHGYYLFVTFLGTRDEASEYRFEVSVEDKEGKQRCSFEGPVEPFGTRFEELTSSGSYLQIGYPRHRCLEDENRQVRYKVKLLKKKDDKASGKKKIMVRSVERNLDINPSTSNGSGTPEVQSVPRVSLPTPDTPNSVAAQPQPPNGFLGMAPKPRHPCPVHLRLASASGAHGQATPSGVSWFNGSEILGNFLSELMSSANRYNHGHPYRGSGSVEEFDFPRTQGPVEIGGEANQELTFPCPNRRHGCPQIISSREQASHQAECWFSLVRCQVNNCFASVLRKDISEHFRSHHWLDHL